MYTIPKTPVQTIDPTSIPSSVTQGWKLTWSDEFDGTTLDRTKWTVRFYFIFFFSSFI